MTCHLLSPGSGVHRKRQASLPVKLIDLHMTVDPMEPTLKRLHYKFRNLLALLRLLRAINGNSGQPTLNMPNAPKLEELPGRQEFTDAITTILVMNHEIIAGVPLRPQESATEEVSIVLNQYNSVNGSMYQVSGAIADNEEGEADYAPSEYAEFAACANPRYEPGNGVSQSGDSTIPTGMFLVSDPHHFWHPHQAEDFSDLIQSPRYVFSLPLTSI